MCVCTRVHTHARMHTCTHARIQTHAHGHECGSNDSDGAVHANLAVHEHLFVIDVATAYHCHPGVVALAGAFLIGPS